MCFLYNPMASVCPVIIIILLVISVVRGTRGASITRNDFQAAVDDPKTERNSVKILGASELKQRNLINHNSIKGALEGDDDSPGQREENAAAVSLNNSLKRSQLPSPRTFDKQYQSLVMAGRSRQLVSTLIPAPARLPAPSLRTRRLSSRGHAERLPASAIGLMEDPPSFAKPHQGARTRRIVFQRSSPKATSQLPRGTSSVALSTVEHRHRRDIDLSDIYSSLDSSSLSRRRRQDGDSEGDDDDDSANDDGDSDESDNDNENGDDTDDGGIDLTMLRKKRGSETTNDTVETYVKQKENVNTIDTLSDSLPAAVRRRRQIDSDDDSDDVSDDNDVDHGDGDTGEDTDDVSFEASVSRKKREPKRKQMRFSEQDAADENGSMLTGAEEVMSQESLAYDRPPRQVDTDSVKKADIEKEPMETDDGDHSGSIFNDSNDVYDSSHAGGGVHIIDASSETNSKRWSDVTGGIEVVSVHHGTPSLLTHSFTSTDRQRRQSNIVQDIISADDEMDESEDIEDTDIDEEEDENDNVDLTMFRKRRVARRNENKELFQHHAHTKNEATNSAFISKSSRQYARVMPAVPDLAAHKQEFGLGYISSPDHDTLNISSIKTQLLSGKNTASPRKLLRSQRSSTATLNADKRVLQVLNSGDETGNDGEDEIESDLDLLLNDLVGSDEIDLDDSHTFQIV